MEKGNMKIHKGTGILIACEGISGCGKSESIRELSRYLNSLGYVTYLVEWNSNCTIRKIVSSLKSKKMLNSLTYSLLQWIGFLKDYYTSILPLLKKDCIVIADRYIHTGITRDKVNGTTGFIGKLICKLVRVPDLNFFFDTDPSTCKKRIEKRDKKLFHPGKKIRDDNSIPDKELFYLNKLRLEYVKLYEKLEESENTNVFNIINNHCHINDYVKDYIDQKQMSVTENDCLKQALSKCNNLGQLK